MYRKKRISRTTKKMRAPLVDIDVDRTGSLGGVLRFFRNFCPQGRWYWTDREHTHTKRNGNSAERLGFLAFRVMFQNGRVSCVGYASTSVIRLKDVGWRCLDPLTDNNPQTALTDILDGRKQGTRNKIPAFWKMPHHIIEDCDFLFFGVYFHIF